MATQIEKDSYKAQFIKKLNGWVIVKNDCEYLYVAGKVLKYIAQTILAKVFDTNQELLNFSKKNNILISKSTEVSFTKTGSGTLFIYIDTVLDATYMDVTNQAQIDKILFEDYGF